MYLKTISVFAIICICLFLNANANVCLDYGRKCDGIFKICCEGFKCLPAIRKPNVLRCLNDKKNTTNDIVCIVKFFQFKN